MFKKIGLFVLLTLLLALAACSPAATAQASGASTGSSQTAAGTPQPGQGQMNTETRLLLGTLNLEGTSQAVTKDQAAQLLPLWKALNTLSTSQTTSQEEIDALYKQISDTMTPEQTKAIDDMQLTFQSMGEIMQKLGITPVAGGFGGQQGTASPEQQATRQARIAQGGGNFNFGGGNGGGGNGGGGRTGGGGQGFVPGGGQGFPADGGQGFFPGGGQSGTPVAGRGFSGRNRANPELVNALIKLLEDRAG